MVECTVVHSIASAQPQAVLLAFQHIRKMTGKTQSHLMRASDGNLYVTKFGNNPIGIRVLASEFLATKIGLFLGLPMPEVAVIEVPDLLIKDTPSLQMEREDGEIIRCASGQHLAVRYVCDVWKDRVFGCGSQPESRHIVILPDVSGSIARESLEQAFKAIDELVGQLHRGDRIAIIPILGDAQAQASGRIIRFEVPRERRAYDADLRDFRHKLSTSLAEMRANAEEQPGSKTDILGSVELAKQEFEAAPGRSAHMLLVLSDFIQEDGELDFTKDARLTNPGSSRQLAMQLAKMRPFDFQGARVYLGLLRSSEYGALTKKRRNAIQDFWAEYFKLSRGQTQAMTDGVGLMESSLNGKWQ